MSSPESTRPRCTGWDNLRDTVSSMVYNFTFNNAFFSVVVADAWEPAGQALLPVGYDFDGSIEGKLLEDINDTATHDGTDPLNPERLEAVRQLEDQLIDLAVDACLPTMRRLAPSQIPKGSTLQDELYPTTYALQILTENDKLVCRLLDDDTMIPDWHPPVPEDKLQAIGLNLDNTDLPVVSASQVYLVQRLKSFVWTVKVNGEEMVCKASIHVFKHAIGDELATYLKIGAPGVKLRVPQLIGIIKSNRGVVGLLLGYIPHKHHSLHALLTGVEEGTIPASEATPSARQQWAQQIRETVAGLHSLGILWRDLKTQNVLIDDNGDAVVLDFGGGNSVGWVDHDKYATMEGEEQGLAKIMEALGVEA